MRRHELPTLHIDRAVYSAAVTATQALTIVDAAREGFVHDVILKKLVMAGRILPGEALFRETGTMTPHPGGETVYWYPGQTDDMPRVGDFYFDEDKNENSK